MTHPDRGRCSPRSEQSLGESVFYQVKAFNVLKTACITVTAFHSNIVTSPIVYRLVHRFKTNGVEEGGNTQGSSMLERPGEGPGHDRSGPCQRPRPGGTGWEAGSRALAFYADGLTDFPRRVSILSFRRGVFTFRRIEVEERKRRFSLSSAKETEPARFAANPRRRRADRRDLVELQERREQRRVDIRQERRFLAPGERGGSVTHVGERDRAPPTRTHGPERAGGAEARHARNGGERSEAAARPDRRKRGARDSVVTACYRALRRSADPRLQEPASYARNWGSARLMPGDRAAETGESGVSR